MDRDDLGSPDEGIAKRRPMVVLREGLVLRFGSIQDARRVKFGLDDLGGALTLDLAQASGNVVLLLALPPSTSEGKQAIEVTIDWQAVFSSETEPIAAVGIFPNEILSSSAKQIKIATRLPIGQERNTWSSVTLTELRPAEAPYHVGIIFRPSAAKILIHRFEAGLPAADMGPRPDVQSKPVSAARHDAQGSKQAKRNVIAFKARDNDPATASFRLRVLMPIEALTRRGHAVEIFDPARAHMYGTVVFSKWFDEDDLALVQSLRQAGTRVIYDTCDNQFYNPHDLPKYQRLRTRLTAMITGADRVICSTPALAAVVEREAALGQRPVVVGDMVETVQAAAGEAQTSEGEPRLLWFGVHGSANAKRGMEDLLLIEDELIDAHRRTPFELVVCSNSRRKYETLIAPLPLRSTYVEWSLKEFPQHLHGARTVLLPLSDNEFVQCKSHSRLTTALAAGVPVIADAMQAYNEFAPFCYLGDWANSLRTVLEHPQEARERARGAADYIRAHWSIAALAREWEQALDLPSREIEVDSGPYGTLRLEADGGLQARVQSRGVPVAKQASLFINGHLAATATCDADEDGSFVFPREAWAGHDAPLLRCTLAIGEAMQPVFGSRFDIEPSTVPGPEEPKPSISGSVELKGPILSGAFSSRDDLGEFPPIEVVSDDGKRLQFHAFKQSAAEGPYRYIYDIPLGNVFRDYIKRKIQLVASGSDLPLHEGTLEVGPFGRDGFLDAGGYLASREELELLHSLPIENHASSVKRMKLERAYDRLVNRLKREREFFASDVSAELDPEAKSLFVLLDDDAELEPLSFSVLRWSLQSYPRSTCLVITGADNRNDLSCTVISRRKLDEVRKALVSATWCFFGRPGDCLHPSAAGISARWGDECEVLVWNLFEPHTLRDCTSGVVTRRPKYDPHTVRHYSGLDTTLAVRGPVFTDIPDNVLDALCRGEMHAFAIWLTTQQTLRWKSHDEALTARTQPKAVANVLNASHRRLLRSILKSSPDYEIRTPPSGPPDQYVIAPRRRAKKISVVICYRDAAEMTVRCLASIAEQKVSGELEVVLVNNQSGNIAAEEISANAAKLFQPSQLIQIDYDKPFNHSDQNNIAVAAASGDVIVICNNDVLLNDERILEEAASWALSPDVATVGIKLLDQQGRPRCFGHIALPSSDDPFTPILTNNKDPSFADLIHAVPGNTLAFAAIARDRFIDLGGLDAVRFPIGYNDAEFMLRSSRRGLVHVYIGYLSGTHCRGATRTGDNEGLQITWLRQLYPESAGGYVHQLSRQVVGEESLVQAKPPKRRESQASFINIGSSGSHEGATEAQERATSERMARKPAGGGESAKSASVPSAEKPVLLSGRAEVSGMLLRGQFCFTNDFGPTVLLEISFQGYRRLTFHALRQDSDGEGIGYRYQVPLGHILRRHSYGSFKVQTVAHALCVHKEPIRVEPSDREAAHVAGPVSPVLDPRVLESLSRSGSENDVIRLTLSLGNLTLGEMGACLRRSDLSAPGILEELQTIIRPSVPSLQAFSAMSGGSSVLPLKVEAAVGQHASFVLPTPSLDLHATFQPLAAAAIGTKIKISDLWFSGGYALRLRLESVDGTESKVATRLQLLAYQAVFQPESHLLALGQAEHHEDLSFATFNLHNPFLPILLVLKNEAGNILSVDMVPFPSLCRGGLHYPELRAAATLGDDLADLRDLSDTLFRDFIGWTGAPPRQIGSLAIDPRGAIGAEPIFAADIIEWLRSTMKVRLSVQYPTGPDALDPTASTHLSALLPSSDELEDPDGGGTDQLILPVDAVPTISALVRRTPEEGAASIAACPYLVASASLTSDAWAVGLPHVGSWISDLQPAGAYTPFPMLRISGNATGEGSKFVSARPMAIRLLQASTAKTPEDLFPIDPAVQNPLRRSEIGEPAMVSVCLAVGDASPDWILLLESIAQQDCVGRIEIVIAAGQENGSAHLAQISPALDRLFPDRHKIVHVETTDNPTMMMNAAAAAASARLLLFAAPDMVLQDARTISVLSLMASEKQVATASCLLVRPAPKGFDFACAGYFLTGLRMTSPPAVSYEALDCRRALALSTYPVAANPLSLLMVDADIFMSLGGFDQQIFPRSGCDIEFGLRVLQEGLFNLNTTCLSAYASTLADRGRLDVDILYRLPRMDWGRGALLATSLRKVL